MLWRWWGSESNNTVKIQDVLSKDLLWWGSEPDNIVKIQEVLSIDLWWLGSEPDNTVKIQEVLSRKWFWWRWGIYVGKSSLGIFIFILQLSSYKNHLAK